MTDGVARKGFDLDLLDGEARESEFVRLVADAEVRRLRVEVKSDGLTQRTANVFIEYQYKGQPSGISTTTAAWWAVELVGVGVWLLLPVERLRVLARRAYLEGRVANGGDYNNSAGVLLPAEWLVRAGGEAHDGTA